MPSLPGNLNLMIELVPIAIKKCLGYLEPNSILNSAYIHTYRIVLNENICIETIPNSWRQRKEKLDGEMC